MPPISLVAKAAGHADPYCAGDRIVAAQAHECEGVREVADGARHKARSRSLMLLGLVLLAACFLWGVFACGGTSTTTTTAAPATTSTTAGPTGTVGEAPTVTSAASSAGVPSALISKDKTLADVARSLTPTGKEITTPIDVPDQLQAAFQTLHPNAKILYVGPHNRGPKDSLEGNELNDSIVTVGGLASLNESGLTFPHFGGIFPMLQKGNGTGGQQAKDTTVFPEIAMEFKDIVLIPGSIDFYIHGIDPTNRGADIYVRIVRESNSPFDITTLACFDLNNKDGFFIDFANYSAVDKAKHSAVNIPLDSFFIPGDTLAIFPDVISTPVSGNEDLRNITFKLDENGKQTAAAVAVIRLAGADKINSLF